MRDYKIFLIFLSLLLVLSPLSTARFIQPDPVIPNVYEPQSLNRYSYALNNPYKYTDPTGNTPWDVVDVVFIGYGAYEFYNDPSLSNLGSLAIDVGFAVTPIVPNIKRGAEGLKALENSKVADNIINKISGEGRLTPNQIGKIGESKLTSEFGGEAQKRFATGSGDRIVDQFSKETGVAREAKTGYKTLSKDIRSQIDKDAALLKDTDSGIKSVEWHFYESPVTGFGGASKNLQNYLKKNNIKYNIHKNPKKPK